jgi:hypothetical protein
MLATVEPDADEVRVEGKLHPVSNSPFPWS